MPKAEGDSGAIPRAAEAVEQAAPKPVLPAPPLPAAVDPDRAKLAERYLDRVRAAVSSMNTWMLTGLVALGIIWVGPIEDAWRDVRKTFQEQHSQRGVVDARKARNQSARLELSEDIDESAVSVEVPNRSIRDANGQANDKQQEAAEKIKSKLVKFKVFGFEEFLTPTRWAPIVWSGLLLVLLCRLLWVRGKVLELTGRAIRILRYEQSKPVADSAADGPWWLTPLPHVCANGVVSRQDLLAAFGWTGSGFLRGALIVTLLVGLLAAQARMCWVAQSLRWTERASEALRQTTLVSRQTADGFTPIWETLLLSIPILLTLYVALIWLLQLSVAPRALSQVQPSAFSWPSWFSPWRWKLISRQPSTPVQTGNVPSGGQRSRSNAPSLRSMRNALFSRRGFVRFAWVAATVSTPLLLYALRPRLPRFERRPRYVERKPQRFLRVRLPQGFYLNPTTRILHWVSVRPYGNESFPHIRQVHHTALEKKLVAAKPAPFARDNPHVHFSTASAAFEEAALEALKHADFRAACELLSMGLQYGARGGRPDFRLHDLLAGLAVRHNLTEPDYLTLAANSLRASAAWFRGSSPEARRISALIDTRLAKWSDPKSAWSQRWRNLDRTPHWSGLPM